MKTKFFDTVGINHLGVPAKINSMLEYVVKNQNAVLETSELTALAQQIRTILKTPISEFFERMIIKGSLTNFAAINVSSKDTSVPEPLTMSSIVVDLGALPDKAQSNVLLSSPKLNNKVVVNLTSALKSTPHSNSFIVTNADVLQNTLVRGQLAATFHDDNNGWIMSNTTLFLYALKSYSMILSGIISGAYNLNPIETDAVSTILATFFDQTCGGNIHSPTGLSRWNWGPASSVSVHQGIVSSCQEFVNRDGVMDVMGLCAALSKLVATRMSNFDYRMFISLCSSRINNQDLLMSRIALEYPPYWVYLLLYCLSGNKISLIYQMQNYPELMKTGRQFVNELLVNNAVLAAR